MSERADQAVGRWTDRIFKFAVILGPLMVIWLKSQFVTKEVYENRVESDRARWQQLSDAVLLLTAAKRRDEDQDRMLGDFESRLRYLENRRVTGGRQIDGVYEK